MLRSIASMLHAAADTLPGASPLYLWRLQGLLHCAMLRPYREGRVTA
ncbi:hypothetical protein AOT14_15710 [Stenotrophomonas acidaminiphila]|uniref:Uncharacterized protein n=1 Tax=Stenotrophomonas acidaminiphila TaxID=128780 RepID=A0A0S1AYU5_9GAMM|nr:hypothetical protein AOT14_15710 [Stenotrophomonas acidaminiphila]